MADKIIIKNILDNLDANWPTGNRTIINKNSIIECWSKCIEIPENDFYGVTKYGMSRAYNRIFKNIKGKKSCEPWRAYILRINGYKYCKGCKKLKLVKEFNSNIAMVSNLSNRCKCCVNEAKSNYRAENIKRIPNWLSDNDKQIIKDLYKKAKELEIKNGIKYEVDHIIPLRGKYVCGLHVPINLQILPANENRRKSNIYIIYEENING